MRAINLLPRDDARRNQKTQWIVLVPVVAAVLLTALLSAIFLSASGKVKDKQAELSTSEGHPRCDSRLPTPRRFRARPRSQATSRPASRR